MRVPEARGPGIGLHTPC